MMKKLFQIVLAFGALNAFGAFGTAKPLPEVKVDQSAFNQFLEKLPEVFGISIGDALTDVEVSKLERNKEKNGLYYIRRIKKPSYCMSCYAYVTHKPLQQYYISGFQAKADRTKCTEEKLIASLCKLAGASVDETTAKEGVELCDPERKISIKLESSRGCYYLVTVKCDDVAKCLTEEDEKMEKKLSAKAAQDEKENARQLAEAEQERKRKDEERAKQEKQSAQKCAARENEFKIAFEKNLKTSGACATDISQVGVDFPIASLCGFRLGDSIDCVTRLIQSPVRSSVGSDVIFEGQLIRPFRKFKFARVKFHTRAGLYDIRLVAKGIDDREYSKEDIQNGAPSKAWLNL